MLSLGIIFDFGLLCIPRWLSSTADSWGFIGYQRFSYPILNALNTSYYVWRTFLIPCAASIALYRETKDQFVSTTLPLFILLATLVAETQVEPFRIRPSPPLAREGMCSGGLEARLEANSFCSIQSHTDTFKISQKSCQCSYNTMYD